MAGTDGSIAFDSGIKTDGLKKDLSEMEEAISDSANSAEKKAEAAFQTMEKQAKRLAKAYEEAGMDASDALKKAWKDVQDNAEAFGTSASENFKGIGDVIMPENYTAMFAVPKQSEADKIIEKAIPQADKIIEIIKSGNDIPYGTGGITGKILSAVVNSAFYPLCVKSKAFKANDKCISCGKCEALCPLNNIKLTNGKPAWADNCTHYGLYKRLPRKSN